MSECVSCWQLVRWAVYLWMPCICRSGTCVAARQGKSLIELTRQVFALVFLGAGVQSIQAMLHGINIDINVNAACRSTGPSCSTEWAAHIDFLMMI